MKNRIGLIALFVAVALVSLGAVSAQAVTINATQQFAGSVVNNPGTPNTWSSLSFTGSTVYYNGTGDFSGAGGSASIYTPLPIQNGSLSLPNFLSWTVSGNTVTFDVTSEQILSQTAGSLVLYLLGNTNETGYDSSPSSLTWSISYNSGSSTSGWSATLASPPQAPTPEPASVVLLGLGLALMAFYTYRRRPGKQIGLA